MKSLIVLLSAALLAACGGGAASGSSGNSGVTLTTESSNADFPHTHLNIGTYSVRLNACAKKMGGDLRLAPATDQGGYDPSNAASLNDGDTVTLKDNGEYGVVPYSADISDLTGKISAACYPQTVTLTKQ
jgi:hypothetical protein